MQLWSPCSSPTCLISLTPPVCGAHFPPCLTLCAPGTVRSGRESTIWWLCFSNCHFQVPSSLCYLLRIKPTFFDLFWSEIIYLDPSALCPQPHATCTATGVPCIWLLGPHVSQAKSQVWLISLSLAQMSTCWRMLSHSHPTLCNNWQMTLRELRPESFLMPLRRHLRELWDGDLWVWSHS